MGRLTLLPSVCVCSWYWFQVQDALGSGDTGRNVTSWFSLQSAIRVKGSVVFAPSGGLVSVDPRD